MKLFSITSISELAFAANTILSEAKNKKIFCFYGEMGIGKTTLIKEICKQLGIKEEGNSPTFSLINEYAINTTLKVYHFDLYRLQNESELYDIGYEEYLFSGNYCFIEWPEKIERLLPPEIVKVKIALSNTERVITVI